MRIIGKRDIERYMTRHANAATPLKCWVQKAEQSDWRAPAAIRADFASASFLSGNRVVFNIGGNNFRLVVIAVYVQGLLVVDWIGTHAEYDKRKF